MPRIYHLRFKASGGLKNRIMKDIKEVLNDNVASLKLFSGINFFFFFFFLFACQVQKPYENSSLVHKRSLCSTHVVLTTKATYKQWKTLCLFQCNGFKINHKRCWNTIINNIKRTPEVEWNPEQNILKRHFNSSH